jgi:hypothetical protein
MLIRVIFNFEICFPFIGNSTCPCTVPVRAQIGLFNRRVGERLAEGANREPPLLPVKEKRAVSHLGDQKLHKKNWSFQELSINNLLDAFN